METLRGPQHTCTLSLFCHFLDLFVEVFDFRMLRVEANRNQRSMAGTGKNAQSTRSAVRDALKSGALELTASHLDSGMGLGIKKA